MDLLSYKTEYLQKKCQFVLFDDLGKVLDSCQTLFEMTILTNNNVFLSFPILESLQPSFLEMQPDSPAYELQCLEMDEFREGGIYDFWIERMGKNLFLWIITDNTHHYQYLRILQRERNASLISQEYIELQNRAIFAEKELLNLKNSELQRIYDFKSDFFNHISHEIRTPVHGISGLAGMLRKLTQDPKGIQYIDTILASGKHILGIVNELLDHAKLEAGTMNFEQIAFNLREVAQAATDLFSYIETEKEVLIVNKIASDVPQSVIGDERRLSQILYNLLGNAIKFTKNGTVSLKISVKEKSEWDCILVFKVEDTGIGMSQEQLEQLFQPYYQGESYQQYGGTGLGLVIIKQIIELQHGNISVSSQEEKGTVFTFELPFKIDINLPFTTYLRRQLLENLSILLVDDDRINQMIGGHLLRQWNMKVEIAEDGKQAVEKALQQAFDLILMDVNLPELSGIEATRLILTQKPDLPIVAVTASAEDTDLQACLKAGMQGYLLKPFTQEALYETLMRCLHPVQ